MYLYLYIYIYIYWATKVVCVSLLPDQLARLLRRALYRRAPATARDHGMYIMYIYVYAFVCMHIYTYTYRYYCLLRCALYRRAPAAARDHGLTRGMYVVYI